ncbi:hypothetical protein N0V90_002229 [Kalmusia sp. IMI 367209]|nr:hypothetical protein N0V90_002229 [Kalmusia sp. IMI 367209]
MKTDPGVDSTYGLLCANPKWSGLCKEEERCTYKTKVPPTPVGFWALAASSKFIRNECQEFFMSCTVHSIAYEHALEWLGRLEKHAPRQLNNIKRMTLTGELQLWPRADPQWRGYDIEKDPLPALKVKLPALEAVGLQFQDPYHLWLRWSSETRMQEINTTRWPYWYILGAAQNAQFGRHVTIVGESFVWSGKELYLGNFWTDLKQGKAGGCSGEHQAIFRVLRKGQSIGEAGEESSGAGWSESDIQFEAIGTKWLMEPRRSAQWRMWWEKHT